MATIATLQLIVSEDGEKSKLYEVSHFSDDLSWARPVDRDPLYAALVDKMSAQADAWY